MARVPAKKAGARKSTARKAPAKKAARRAPARAASTGSASTSAVNAPPAGSLDLAGGLRSLLGAVETEVRAVSALSEQIDSLVTTLNGVRDEQAKRLIVLDTLRTSVQDTNLGTFLDKAIRPRRARVEEVMPKRLTQA
jgi:hypothetical protein